MNKNKKKCDTSIRVLETLKILSQQSSSIQDIIKYFIKYDSNSRIYTNEVILKYINTLKVFGFRFVKEKDKYVLLNYPIQFDFNENDLGVILLIEKAASEFPEEFINNEISLFLQQLEKMYSDNTRILANQIKIPMNSKFNFVFKKYEEKIKEYERYCQDKQKLKIIFKNEKSILIEPIEIKYINNKVYLNVYNSLNAQIQNIDFDSIIKIEQLPLKSNLMKMPSSVTFKLKDRLAKAYKLHEGERLLEIESDESIIILNQKEDCNMLIKRLMRYGENCELISPKKMRDDMKNLIKLTLKNYS